MSLNLDKMRGALVLVGMLVCPVVLLFAISIPGHLASGKQVTFDRARSSLSAALSDVQVVGGAVDFVPKQYGYFMVSSYTNTIVIAGSNYQCALATYPEYQFADEGRLAVTTNRVFFWLDYRRGAKFR